MLANGKANRVSRDDPGKQEGCEGQENDKGDQQNKPPKYVVPELQCEPPRERISLKARLTGPPESMSCTYSP